MPAADLQTQLSVVDDGNGGKTLQHESCTVPADLCQQSATLRELLETDGDATLPVPVCHFKAWLRLAVQVASTRPWQTPRIADRFTTLTKLIEV